MSVPDEATPDRHRPQPPTITQLPLPARRDPWVERAACRGLGHEFFYGASRAVTAAKAICQRCPVINPCLEEALKVAYRDDFGVWGGTTCEERRAIKRQRKDVA